MRLCADLLILARATLEGTVSLIPPTSPTDRPRLPVHEPRLLRWEPARHDAGQALATAQLSRSELDVLEDAANGLTARQSASNRSKSSETVKSQRSSVLAKLGARNIVQAVAITVHERQIAGERSAPVRFH